MADPRLDSTLEANLFTAYVPRFPLYYRFTHLGQNLLSLPKKFLRCIGCSKPSSLPPQLRPPGDIPPGQQPVVAPPPSPKRLLLPSRESEDLPALNSDETTDAQIYYTCSTFASGSAKAITLENTVILETFTDAFSNNLKVNGPNGDEAYLLPNEVRASSLLNKGTEYAGKISEQQVNHLIDRRTGFAASILYNTKNREVIISMPPCGSWGMNFRQYGRGFLQWLGFIPKPFSQASELTKLVKKHLDELNVGLPVEQQYKLTLTGQGQGGAMASYAALRNCVPAVVFNPLRLSNGLRARIGEWRLMEADKYIAEVVIQGDRLADSRLSWLYIPLRLLGIRSYGPIGSARRFLVPLKVPSKYTSGSPDKVLRSLQRHGKRVGGISRLQESFPWLTRDDLLIIHRDSSDDDVFTKVIQKKLGSRYNAPEYAQLRALLEGYVESRYLNKNLRREHKANLQNEISSLSRQGIHLPKFCLDLLKEDIQ